METTRRKQRRAAQRTLEHRPHASTALAAAPERWLERAERFFVRELEKVPRLAAVGAGAALLGLAVTLGGSEIAVAAAGAYIVLRTLRDQKGAGQAMREVT